MALKDDLRWFKDTFHEPIASAVADTPFSLDLLAAARGAEMFDIAHQALVRMAVPLQSQAGARNFRHETSSPNWWNGEQFADSAFWVHA